MTTAYVIWRTYILFYKLIKPESENSPWLIIIKQQRQPLVRENLQHGDYRHEFWSKNNRKWHKHTTVKQSHGRVWNRTRLERRYTNTTKTWHPSRAKVHKLLQSPTVTLTWYASQAKVHELQQSSTVTLTRHASQAKVHKLHQSPTVTLTWHASQAKVHKLQQSYTLHPRCTSGGLYVQCIDWHARWELL